MLCPCCQGYVPTALERRGSVMDRKRQEYCKLVEHYYDTRLQELHQETFRQVTDVPLVFCVHEIVVLMSFLSHTEAFVYLDLMCSGEMNCLTTVLNW